MNELLEHLNNELKFKRSEFKRIHKEYLLELKKENRYSHGTGLLIGQRITTMSDIHRIIYKIRLYKQKI